VFYLDEFITLYYVERPSCDYDADNILDELLTLGYYATLVTEALSLRLDRIIFCYDPYFDANY
jgi:hypothetical protein